MRYEAIVIGAGAAGLTAAHEVARAGRSTLVLEARDRPGGRVRWETLDAEIVELGAEFIHGPAPETRALLAQSGGRPVTERGDSWIARGGRLERDAPDFGEENRVLNGVALLNEDVSVDAYLRAQPNLSPLAASMVRYFVEGFDAADTGDASVFGIAAEWNSGVDSIAARPSQSYAPIVELMLARTREAGASIHFEEPARWIERNADGVRVGCDRETYEASLVLITVPTNVLRDNGIQFAPALPAWKRRALDALPLGDVERVVLVFKTPFWESIENGRYRNASFFRDPEGAFGAYWTQYPQRRASVVAWAGGPRATRARERFGSDLAREAVRGFGAMLGDEQSAIEQLVDVYSHDWRSDPYARGAYSYLRVGGGDARSELGRSVDGRLFFAGEAVAGEGQGGTVNGAIVTGLRAAREMLEAFENRHAR